MAKGSGDYCQPPAEMNQSPPTRSVPKGHHAQDKGRGQPDHGGSNSNLKGFGGGGGRGGRSAKGYAEGGSQDRY